MNKARELTGWKEIASYLGVNTRTVQKWELERQLPIRRLPGGRGRVAADIAALEAWRRTDPTLPEGSGGLCYRWPLGHDLLAELRFTGGQPTPAHIDLLRDYLDLVKTALTKSTA